MAGNMILNCCCGYTANLYIVGKYEQMRPKLWLQCCCGDYKIRNIAVAIVISDCSLKQWREPNQNQNLPIL